MQSQLCTSSQAMSGLGSATLLREAWNNLYMFGRVCEASWKPGRCYFVIIYVTIMSNNTTIHKDNDKFFLKVYYIHFHTSDNIAFSEEVCKLPCQLACWRQQMRRKEVCLCKYLLEPWLQTPLWLSTRHRIVCWQQLVLFERNMSSFRFCSSLQKDQYAV